MGPHYTHRARQETGPVGSAKPGQLATLAALAVLLGACLSTPPPADIALDAPDATPDAAMCVDADGDGWRANCPTDAYQDCADGDPAVHPGARELGSDGEVIDRDCSGTGLPTMYDYTDLVAAPLGTGARITTRMGRYDLDAVAGHQLASVLVRTETGTYSPELLYEGPLLEQRSGVHVWDDYLAVLPDASSLEERANGPAIYQALVTYRDGGTPGNAALDGTSLYTITLDGRIHRTDRFTLSQQAIFAGGADYPGVTTHVALAAAATSGATTFSHVAVRDGANLRTAALPTTGPGGPPFSGDPTGWRWTCAYGSDVEVGFTTMIPATGQPTRAKRVTANNGFNPVYRQVALQYDWQIGMGNPIELDLATHRGHVLITPHRRSTGECDLVEAKANAYTSPVDLAFGAPPTGSMVTDVADDENSDGFVEAGGYWAVQAASPTGLTMMFEQPSGTTLPIYATFHIRGLRSDRDPVVMLDGMVATQGQHYRLQPDGADRLWMVVLVGVPAGGEIQLVSPPA